MAFCRIMDWVEPETERSTAIYDQVSARVMPMADEAQGFIAHAAGWTGNGFRIIEFWESKEDCEAFMRDHVMPTVAEVSQGEAKPPAVTAYELHSILAR